ncbi:pentapeptide repeat-containing protein [Rhodococcus sp. MS16]|uniref:pentapeptide repeat-containing protein n=1 Tax=Rhodococcus sp. MS16 TaxID=2579941 RepID=UPI001561AF3A|nr:pentapeptide repeat-containing protein [Rhodococcus sp. MS16]
MSYNLYGIEPKPSRVRRYGPGCGIAAGFGAVGFLLGRAFSVPGTNEFWDLAAQPAATVAAGVGAITAGYIAFHNGEKSRGLDAQHHRETVDGDRESNLQDRYTVAAKQLGDENSAVREAGAYAIAALVDDWLRYGTRLPQPGHAHSQAKTCVHLLCSYLRANRRLDGTDGFEPEEAAVRNSIIGVLRERTKDWHQQENGWIEDAKLETDARIVIDLNGARLRKANLSEANLFGANLSGADLHGSVLNAATLQRANLSRATITRTRLHRTDFTAAELSHADFNLSVGRESIFKGATGMQISFTRGAFRGADFSQAVLYFADFTGARLHGATFSGSNLSSAKFGGTHIEAADFTGSTFDEETEFDETTHYSRTTKWPENFMPHLGQLVEDEPQPTDSDSSPIPGGSA